MRGLSRLLLALFYRRIEVHGLERVPAHGPLIVAANHHNALVDAMLLIATISRRLAPLAKAPLFRHPLVAPFLWLAGAIPVQRRQDAGGAEGGGARGAAPDNTAMFAAATAALARGDAILIFPEGVSQPEPLLLPLRTGLARLALDAVTSTKRAVTILPVGLVFQHPSDFRVGTAVVEIGPPVAIDDLAPSNEHAVRALTDRVTAALRDVIVEAGDVQTLQLLEVAYDVWRADDETPPGRERLAWMREAARRSGALSPELRQRVDVLRAELARYEKDAAGGATTTARQTLRDAFALAVGLPLALLGIAIHGPGYRATDLAVRLLRPEPDTSATYQLMAGVVFFPLTWIVEALVLARGFGTWAVGLFLIALIPTGFYALSWRARLQRFPRELRTTVSGRRQAHLKTRRRWLRDELMALDRLTG